MQNSLSQLVHLLNGDGIPVTSSKIIADAFGKQHNHVSDAIRLAISRLVSQNFGISQNNGILIDTGRYVVTEGSYVDPHGRQQKVYFMNEYFALKIILGFKGEKAEAVKDAFIDEFARMREQLEAQKSMMAHPDFNDPIESAKAWLREAEAKKQAQIEAAHKQEQVECLKVELEVSETALEVSEAAHKEIADADGLFTMAKAADVLGVGRNTLFKILGKGGFIYRESSLGSNGYRPYRKYGRYFDPKVNTFFNNYGNKCIGYTLYMTPAGVAYFSKWLRKNKSELYA